MKNEVCTSLAALIISGAARRSWRGLSFRILGDHRCSGKCMYGWVYRENIWISCMYMPPDRKPCPENAHFWHGRWYETCGVGWGGVMLTCVALEHMAHAKQTWCGEGEHALNLHAWLKQLDEKCSKPHSAKHPKTPPQYFPNLGGCFCKNRCFACTLSAPLGCMHIYIYIPMQSPVKFTSYKSVWVTPVSTKHSCPTPKTLYQTHGQTPPENSLLYKTPPGKKNPSTSLNYQGPDINFVEVCFSFFFFAKSPNPNPKIQDTKSDLQNHHLQKMNWSLENIMFSIPFIGFPITSSQNVQKNIARVPP